MNTLFHPLMVLLAGGVLVEAQEFTLSVKNMTLDESRSCPGGYGGYAMVMTKVSEVKKAPKAVSASPLYGRMDNAKSERLLFFLDESQGTGKGYDRLVADLNGNGDLTDDPVFSKLKEGPQEQNEDYEQANFGPVELPESKSQGIWRPRFYADMYLYNKRELKSASTEERHIGQIRIMTASLLETTVEVNGIKQKFGVVDGNCNFSLPDPATVTTIHRRPNDPGSWYLMPGDFYVRDMNGSGIYDRTATESDAQIFSSVVYFKGKPFFARLSQDLKGIRFEPYTGATGQISVKEGVDSIILGWQGGAGAWDGLTPDIIEGKAEVPAGAYRISSFTLTGKKTASDWIKTTSRELPEKSYAVATGKIVRLDVGCPLVVEVSANKEIDNQGRESSLMGAARSLFGGGSSKATILRLDVVVLGAAGERYSGFFGSAGGYVPPPRFEIKDSTGKELASGNFEYG
ncbi:MAG TPA: hypothetical protein P5186_10435 [Candidatus Paceibacterota bacterium]|nr:hypothetical protein [Verrucomicrobiota bacterium]HRY48453.1 hypothetical protein [Candidatus Paceibacterota bacterium]